MSLAPAIQKKRKDQLNKLSNSYRKLSPYDDFMRHYTFETFRPFISTSKGSGLELGCSDGQMTSWISKAVKSLDVVEGSAKFIAQASAKKNKNTKFFHSLFENYKTTKKYDYIFATYILTHIPDLSAFFTKVKSLLNKEGYLFIAVPNSRVLSRQLALNMGILEDLFSLSENDKNHGHCRAYDRVRLNRDIEKNGLKIVSQGGIILKPLADFQMDLLIQNKILKTEQMNGLFALGKEYPDLSGAIYAVCQLR